MLIKLTSSNPALALLSPDRQSPGQAQISISLNASATTLTFFVYGLASSGQTKITVDVPGFGSITANVQLVPSGFGWSQDKFTSVLYSQSSNGAAINAFALDPDSLLPTGAQSLRPGVSASVAIANLNSDIVSVSTAVAGIAGPNGTATVVITGRAAGNATVQINQPPGFIAPSIRQRLAVTISVPAIYFSPLTIAKDTQAVLQFSTPPVVTYPLTVTSSDPSKLLISTDPAALGFGSVTIPPGSNRPQIYLQALDSQGSVNVTVSEPTYTDGKATVTLAALTVAMYVDTNNSGSITASGRTYSTTTQSPITRVLLGLYTVNPSDGGLIGGATLRPGVGPPQVEVRSSNTAAGRILGSPIRVVDNQYSQGVDFQPVGSGQTDVNVIQPPGFANSDKVTFNVTAPGFAIGNVLMGKDTAITPGFGLPNNVLAPTTNVTVTITSSDPSRVRLSRDANSAPAASLTSTLVAGQHSFSGVMIHPRLILSGS